MGIPDAGWDSQVKFIIANNVDSFINSFNQKNIHVKLLGHGSFFQARRFRPPLNRVIWNYDRDIDIHVVFSNSVENFQEQCVSIASKFHMWLYPAIKHLFHNQMYSYQFSEKLCALNAINQNDSQTKIVPTACITYMIYGVRFVDFATINRSDLGYLNVLDEVFHTAKTSSDKWCRKKNEDRGKIIRYAEKENMIYTDDISMASFLFDPIFSEREWIPEIGNWFAEKQSRKEILSQSKLSDLTITIAKREESIKLMRVDNLKTKISTAVLSEMLHRKLNVHRKELSGMDRANSKIQHQHRNATISLQNQIYKQKQETDKIIKERDAVIESLQKQLKDQETAASKKEFEQKQETEKLIRERDAVIESLQKQSKDQEEASSRKDSESVEEIKSTKEYQATLETKISGYKTQLKRVRAELEETKKTLRVSKSELAVSKIPKPPIIIPFSVNKDTLELADSIAIAQKHLDSKREITAPDGTIHWNDRTAELKSETPSIQLSSQKSYEKENIELLKEIYLGVEQVKQLKSANDDKDRLLLEKDKQIQLKNELITELYMTMVSSGRKLEKMHVDFMREVVGTVWNITRDCYTRMVGTTEVLTSPSDELRKWFDLSMQEVIVEFLSANENVNGQQSGLVTKQVDSATITAAGSIADSRKKNKKGKRATQYTLKDGLLKKLRAKLIPRLEIFFESINHLIRCCTITCDTKYGKLVISTGKKFREILTRIAKENKELLPEININEETEKKD